ncbi:hypothetical protein MBLNU459_g3820t1 [Dothideomycetes sp. NU459]
MSLTRQPLAIPRQDALADEGTQDCFHQEPLQRRKSKKTSRANQPPPQKARVLRLADSTVDGVAEQSGVDQQTLDKIRKCFGKAQHPNTSEAEAKAAYQTASRLMRKHNVEHLEDILQGTTVNGASSRLGDESEVAIERGYNDGKKVKQQTWVSTLVHAMEIFFDCKSYYSVQHDQNHIIWTFYGLAANTATAALAFESSHNSIMQWAEQRRGGKVSYRLGAADGLEEMALEDRRTEARLARVQTQRELAERIKKENAQRQGEIDRLVGPGVASKEYCEVQQDPMVCRQANVEQKRKICDDSDNSLVTNDSQKRGRSDDRHATKVEDDSGSAKASSMSRGLAKSSVEANAVHMKVEDDSDNDILFSGSHTYGRGVLDGQTCLDDSLNDRNRMTGDSDSEDSDCDSVTNEASDDEASDDEAKSRLWNRANDTVVKEEVKLTPKLKVDLETEATTSFKADPDENFHGLMLRSRFSSQGLEERDNIYEDQDELLTSRMTTHAVVRFRELAQDIAEKYLESRGIKLNKGTAVSRNVRDFEAYDKGKRDSRSIDVKRRRVEPCGGT